MHRFVLVLFGISTAFSSVCTMAYARADGMPMEHAVACEGTAGMCVQEAQTPCMDGSCFVPSPTQEEDALSPGMASLSGVAAQPPRFDAVTLGTLITEPAGSTESPRAPPDLLSSVVLRE